MNKKSLRIASGSLLLAAILMAGCAQLQENLDAVTEARPVQERAEAPAPSPTPQAQQQPATTAPQQEKEHQVTSPVRVTIDGAEDKPADQFGIYWNIRRPVSPEPHVTISTDPKLGNFERVIINLYKTDEEGKETGKPWAITDFGGEQLLLPNRAISLSKPGAVTIISPEGERVDSIPLASGETYVALFVVSGSKESHTHKVRFTIR